MLELYPPEVEIINTKDRITIDLIKDGEDFSTVGVDSNILGSALEALEKGFRYYLSKNMRDNETNI